MGNSISGFLPLQVLIKTCSSDRLVSSFEFPAPAIRIQSVFSHPNDVRLIHGLVVASSVQPQVNGLGVGDPIVNPLLCLSCSSDAAA